MNEDKMTAVLLTDEERMLLSGALALVFSSIQHGQALTGELAQPQISLGIIITSGGLERYSNLLKRITPQSILDKF
jgi:hypothetical protein